MVTADSLNKWMNDHRETPDKGGDFPILPGIECHDGFSISVQCHFGAYSQPRVSYYDRYIKVECGFPNGPVPELAEWKYGDKDDRSTDMKSVYGYVPIEVVADLLTKHGGIKGARS